MSDHTTGRGSFASGETVDAFLDGNEGVAAAASATASATDPIGAAAFTGLKPGRKYTLVGATSGRRVNITTSDEGLGEDAGRPGAPRELSGSFNPAALDAAECEAQNATVQGVDVGDTVLYVGRTGVEPVVVMGVGPIVTANTVPVFLFNPTAGSVDVAAQTFRFLVLKKRTNV